MFLFCFNRPFCFDYVSYPTCIPKFQSMPPTLEFPDGRWFNHSVSQKDAWVKAKALEHISVRIGFERNRTLKNTGRNEYGGVCYSFVPYIKHDVCSVLAIDPGITTVRFFNNRDCQNAYKSYFCWINFPRCDIVTVMPLFFCLMIFK